MTRPIKRGSGFIYLLYFVARAIAFPLLVLYFLYRGYRNPRYFRNFTERLGTLKSTYKRTAPGSIWLHAVSVGEVITAVRLIEELRAANPNIPIYVSTTTLSGRSIAEQKLKDRVDGIFFAPIDYVFAARRVMRRIRPAVVVILETEIWPVLYREVKRTGAALLIVNGRISDRALPRYRRFRPVFRAALAWPDAIYVQSEAIRERYIDLGAPPERTRDAGNLKYDAVAVQEPPPEIRELLHRTRPDHVWIAASTMPPVDSADLDENEIVLRTFQELAVKYPRSLLILAPRKPERFDAAAESLSALGIGYVRRSRLGPDSTLPLPGVLLLDTMGELASIFSLADVVFMGGTLARRGGHNILEPAFAARPIVIGPHMENFAAIAAEFRDAGAVAEIDSPARLTAAIDTLFSNEARRMELGRRGAELAERKRGVTARMVHEILAAQDSVIPAWDFYGLRKQIAGLFSNLWRWGGVLKQRTEPRVLSTAVISVGGIAMGGSGKTPFVLMLAQRFHERGVMPAILTRGYRRRSLARMILIEAGKSAPASVTGDEAQIFVQSGVAHVGICSDRWEAGRAVEEKSHADVFLLDDGFQHRRLKRDLDIVLIDALDPFAGGAVFPRGRLREPLESLARADIFVITRVQEGRHYEGLRKRLRELNPKAPVFLSHVRPRRWIHAQSGFEAGKPDGPVAAFCGLGNPNSFWETLHALDIVPVFAWSFGDHQVYKPLQLRRLAAQAKSRGAAVLVTTQKDAMNLPDNFAKVIAPIELYWLEVETRVDGEDELLRLISGVAGIEIKPGFLLK